MTKIPRRAAVLGIVSLVVLTAPLPALALEDEAAGPPPVSLSLNEAIRMAVERNLDIRVARFEPERSRQDEIGARAFFDPLAFGRYSKDKENQEPTDFLATSSSQFDLYTAGLTQQFITGADASLVWSNTRSDRTAAFPISFNPSYGTNLAFSFTQPLLQGFGARPERNGILIARNNVEVSLSEVRRTVMTTVRQVTDAYWDLAAAISNLRVATQSLELARNLLELNRAKVEVGTLAPIEITQAEAGVASREEAVIVAENAIRTAEDVLRRVLNAPRESDLWHRPLSPSDEPPFEVLDFESPAEVAAALEKRPELEQTRLRLRNLELQAASDRNGVLPQLDLTGSYGLSGIAGDQRFSKIDTNFDGTPDCDTRQAKCNPSSDRFVGGTTVDRNGDGFPDSVFVEETISDAWEQLADRDLVSWGVGLNVSIPIGNRAARARAARSRISVDQGRVELENAEQRIEIEVRNAVRQVQTNIKRVQAARVNVGLQREKLEAEQKRFQYGMTTSFQVLEFQNDLTEAESAEIRAVIDYNKSLAALADATGGILDRYGIEVR